MDTQRPLNWLGYTLKTEFYFNSKQTRKNNCLDTSQNFPCLFGKKKKLNPTITFRLSHFGWLAWNGFT